MGLGCDEPKGTSPRRDLIKAAGKLDQVAVRQLLDNAPTAAERKNLLALECNPGTWGARHDEAALHAAIKGLPREADDQTKQQWVEILRFLLENGGDPNDKFADYNWKGTGHTETAFEMVLNRGALGDVDLLKMFLDAGADPELPTIRNVHSMRTDGHTSHTPLHTVVAGGVAVDCAIELIKAGADVNACRIEHMTNERGFGQDRSDTSLHIAIENGSVEMCSLLLGNGADVDAEQKYLHVEQVDVESPTDDPRDPRFISSVRLVQVRQRALHIAIKNNDPDLVRLLVLHGADRAATCSFGGQEKTAEELCAEQEISMTSKQRLGDALKAEWSTDTHKFFPEKFRDSVRTTLLTAKRQDWPLNADIMGQIFAGAADIKAEATAKESNPKITKSD